MIPRSPSARGLLLALVVTVLTPPPTARSQEVLVGIEFTNPGYATMNVYRVLDAQGRDEHWGAVARMSTSIRIPSHPGELWRFRLAASANANTEQIRYEYRATSEPVQRVQLPGFLENERDPGPDYARHFVANLGKVVEAVLNTLALSSPDLICPNGEALRRPRGWNAGVWRAEPIHAIEADVRTSCTTPSGLPQSEANWWYGKASEDYNACSGPVGDWLSRWGPNWRFMQDACVVHDLCYTSTIAKDQCDANFVQNMQALCKAPGFGDWATYPVCTVTKNIISDLFWHPDFRKSYDNDQDILRRRMGTGP